MLFKNVASQKIHVYAYDSTTGAPKTGDAGNITGYVSLDGTANAIDDTNPTEVDATNMPGVYAFDLTQAETNCNSFALYAKSSTSNIRIEPIIGFTTGAAGSLSVNASAIGGTTQTGRDLGASVLLSNGTGAGQVSLTSGSVTVAAIAANAITATVIADNAITAAKINAGAITAAKFAVAAINASAIAPSAITNAKFAAGAIDAAAIANGAIDAATFAADVDAEILSYLVDDATRIDASALNTATVTTIPAILADTGTDGVVVAAASKTGYTLTATTGLGNQTANITGNLSGSVGSVTGAVGSVTGAVGSVTGNVGGNVVGSVGSVSGDTKQTADVATLIATVGVAGAGLTALASAANLATVAGYLDTEIAAILADTNELQTDWANGGRLDLILDARASQASVDTIDGIVDSILADTNELQTDWADGGRLDLILDAASAPSAAAVADAVWDELLSGHTGAGSAGSALATASSGGVDPAVLADAIWDEALSGHSTAGTTGKKLTDLANADLSGVATAAELAKVPKSDGTETWNTTALASLQSEANDALAAFTGDTGITLAKALEMLAAFMAGKVTASSAGGVTTYTYKKRDGSTTSFTAACSETDGTRDTTGSLS